MRGRNSREPYRGHQISFDADGWWQVESPDIGTDTGDLLFTVGGFARDSAEAEHIARDFVDGVAGRRSNPPRIANIVVRKPQAEQLLRKDLSGRKTDYYVLSEPKNLGGPYPSLAKAKKRLRQVEYFKRAKPSRKRNWSSPDEAAEYALKRWGHANYIAGAPNDQTWSEFAAFIRETGDPGSKEAAREIERLTGLPIDFPLPVEPVHPSLVPPGLLPALVAGPQRFPNKDPGAGRLTWRRQRRIEGPLAKGDYVSADLAPGIRYELRRRKGWDVYLRRGDTVIRVASDPDLERAKRSATRDARDVLELAREIAGTRAANPKDRWDLQTVIVDKSVAATRDEAAEIARDFGKRIYTSRQTKDSWRFRQRPPGEFVKGTFRTRPIRGRGVSLVYGRLKRTAKAPTTRRPRR